MDARTQMANKVAAQTTPMLRTMHGKLAATIRSKAGQGYLAVRPEALSILAVEAELLNRGETLPPR